MDSAEALAQNHRTFDDDVDTSAALLILAGSVVGAWLWLRARHSAQRRAERQLHRICLGDAAQAERLIENEIARSPGISRAEAANRAVGRYQRDNL